MFNSLTFNAKPVTCCVWPALCAVAQIMSTTTGVNLFCLYISEKIYVAQYKKRGDTHTHTHTHRHVLETVEVNIHVGSSLLLLNAAKYGV